MEVLKDPQLRFTGKPRTQPIRGVVVHYTGGEGSAQQVYNVLKSRGLSVHYHIDQKGRVTQYAPYDVVCLHAGPANHWSVGIEVSCVGHGVQNPRWPRTRYPDEIHGKKVRQARFYPEQQAALNELVTYLCDELELPREVAPGSTLLSSWDLSRFRGVLGHFHLSRNKLDPGSEPLQGIRDHWAVGRVLAPGD